VREAGRSSASKRRIAKDEVEILFDPTKTVEKEEAEHLGFSMDCKYSTTTESTQIAVIHDFRVFRRSPRGYVSPCKTHQVKIHTLDLAHP
jgi:hypothetical protein